LFTFQPIFSFCQYSQKQKKIAHYTSISKTLAVPDVERVLEDGEGPLLATAQEDGFLPVLNRAVWVVIEDAGHALFL
jgi:hypothetical protein